jgi:hypothetical protein
MLFPSAGGMHTRGAHIERVYVEDDTVEPAVRV